MDSGITNNVENLSRLLTMQMIFSIIVHHSILSLWTLPARPKACFNTGYSILSLRSRRLEVAGERENGRSLSPSRAPVFSCAHYLQAPATQATVFLTSFNYCQSWIQEIKKRCVSCLIDLWGQSFPWHIVTCCEQVNPASANGRTTLYLQTLQWAFPVVSRKLLTKLKRKPIAKQNVIFSLELRSRLEIQRALAFYLNIFLFIGMNSVLFSRSYHRWPKRNMRVCMGKIEFENLMK